MPMPTSEHRASVSSLVESFEEALRFTDNALSLVVDSFEPDASLLTRIPWRSYAANLCPYDVDAYFDSVVH